MDTKDILDAEPNPWHPMNNSVDLKHMGKLIEECGELVAAASRCIIQGIDEKEPKSIKPNRQWLTEEIADVLANIQLVCEHFSIDPDQERIVKKMRKLREWHRMA